MADRVHSVFVSSTFQDLQEERLGVSNVLLRATCLPAGMELFAASARPPWETIKRALDLADYMVLILAGRYGSILEGTKKSYTENEYEYALEHDIPVLAFVHKDLGLLTHDRVETERIRQVKAFHKRALNGPHTAAFWTDTASLKEAVALAIPAALRDSPRPGWVRGNAVVAAPPVDDSVMAVAVERVGSEPLCPLRSSDDRFERAVQSHVDEALSKLPPERRERGEGVSAASVLGQGIFSIIRESEAVTNSLMAPETRTRQQYVHEVEDYGQRLREGFAQARLKLAGRMLAPLVLGVRNLRPLNLFNAQLRLTIEGPVEVVLPPDVDDDWSPLDELPDPPRAWGPTPRFGETVSGWLPPDLSGLYRQAEVEVEVRDGRTVLTYPPMDIRPEDTVALDPVVLIIPDAVQRTRKARWTLTATNKDHVLDGEIEIDFLGAPRDVWAEWAASSGGQEP